MVDDGTAQSEPPWPLPEFCFQVKWDNTIMLFQQLSGLRTEVQPVEDHHGDKPIFNVVGMPGTQKIGNITAKRGVFKSDNEGRAWLNEMTRSTPKPVPVTISLLDEQGSAILVWALANAWPANITFADPKADGNEIAVDTLEIAHQGLTFAMP